MTPLTPEEIVEMIDGIDELLADLDEMEETLIMLQTYHEEYRKEVAVREAQEELNAECIAVIEGRDVA
jgi:hypothetical protein